MPDLRLFIGYDSREPVAFHVFAHSLYRRASGPISVSALVQQNLRDRGLYTRERNPLESTEFSFTRFLVPYLCDYRGFAVFADCDMLALADPCELWPEIRAQMMVDPWVGRPESPKSVLVAKHDYTPRAATKMDGQVQTAYPRKNWSSLIVFDCSACKALTPEYVNTASGLQLHRFLWLNDGEIGDLPLEWNHLVDEYEPNERAKILHYTNGGPWFDGYEDCDHADLWLAERELTFGTGAKV